MFVYRYGYNGTPEEIDMPSCHHGFGRADSTDLDPATENTLHYQLIRLPAENCAACATLAAWLLAKPDVSEVI